jgi:methanogenic corrinoid protein MtbC1
MAESVAQRVSAIPDGLTEQELRQLLAALVNGLQAVMAKLDADAGVTDTDYATTLATYVTD